MSSQIIEELDLAEEKILSLIDFAASTCSLLQEMPTTDKDQLKQVSANYCESLVQAYEIMKKYSYLMNYQIQPNPEDYQFMTGQLLEQLEEKRLQLKDDESNLN